MAATSLLPNPRPFFLRHGIPRVRCAHLVNGGGTETLIQEEGSGIPVTKDAEETVTHREHGCATMFTVGARQGRKSGVDSWGRKKRLELA